MTGENKLTFDALMALARTTASVGRVCVCAIESYREWTRVPPSFPSQQMRIAGVLVEDPYMEATFTEFHRAGTSYWSAGAPIAWRHFPYNRCNVLQCTVCERCCLSYVEAGGYYVEPRIRVLDPALVVDAPVDD